jgi:mono/diheme cytochrome c family protein
MAQASAKGKRVRLTIIVFATLGMVSGARGLAAQEPVAGRGRQVYDRWCTPCHGSGEGRPGTIAAAALYKGSKPAVLTERTDLTSAGIKSVVRTGMFIMPRFRKTEVTDAELEAIVAYLTRSTTPRP